jgi:hypothetical protein
MAQMSWSHNIAAGTRHSVSHIIKLQNALLHVSMTCVSACFVGTLTVSESAASLTFHSSLFTVLSLSINTHFEISTLVSQPPLRPRLLHHRHSTSSMDSYFNLTPDAQFTNLPPPPVPPPIPLNLTQALVNANPTLKRFQQDLLILTSFHDTSTLHWRPSWFPQHPHNTTFWTLYNPPNVITELLPHARLGRLVYTRRMRKPDDPEPMYVKSWEDWERVCGLRGVPRDYLCREQVGLMRMGLGRDGKGDIVGEFEHSADSLFLRVF